MKRLLHTLILLILAYMPTNAAMPGSDYEEACRLLRANEYNDALRKFQAYIIAAQAGRHGNAKTDTLAQAYLNTGKIYTIYEDYGQALHFYRLAWQILRRSPDGRQRVESLTKIVGAFCEMGIADSAELYNERLKNLEGGDRALGEFYYTFNKGYIAKVRHDEKAKVAYMIESAKIVGRNHLDESMKLWAWSEIYPYYEDKGDYATALKYLGMYHDLGRRLGLSYIVARSYKAYMRIYTKAGDTRRALEYQKLYFAAQDSLLDVKGFNSLKNNYEQYEKEIYDLKLRSLAQVNAMKTKLLAVLGLSLLCAVAAALVLFRQRQTINRSYRTLYSLSKQMIDQHDMGPVAGEKLKAEVKYDVSELVRKIEQVMADEKVFLSPDFSLNTLAKLAESNTMYVSQAINNTFSMNFRSYVNQRRVKVAMRRLADDTAYGNISIQGIAEGVGFKSQTNFIQAFKKVTGITPSIYRKLAISDKNSTDLKISNDN